MGRPRKNPASAPAAPAPEVGGSDNQVFTAIMALAKSIGSLEKIMIERLPESPKGIVASTPAPATTDTPTPAQPEKDDSVPVPHEWRDVIDRVLNAKFDARVTYLPNGRFELVINVPKEYSNATPREWDMMNSDRRIKVMDNYLGAEGVRIYCETVATHLGPEIRAKIADDRAKLVTA